MVEYKFHCLKVYLTLGRHTSVILLQERKHIFLSSNRNDWISIPAVSPRKLTESTAEIPMWNKGARPVNHKVGSGVLREVKDWFVRQKLPDCELLKHNFLVAQ